MGAVTAGPAGIGGGARGVVATPVITNYSGDGSWLYILLPIPAATIRS